MKAIELFAGIGGFRVACDSLGIETVWANDISPVAATVYRKRFGEREFHLGDVSSFLEDIPDHDLLTGGFPCQPFSSAGRKLGVEDARGSLFEKIVQVLKMKRPEYFVLENVKRLLSMDSGRHFATILHALSEAGYLIEWRLLNAVNFGLPQHRERVVIIGHKGGGPRSYLCTAADISELTPHQASMASSVDRWKDIEDHSSKFHKWGLAIDGKFFHADIDGFSEAVRPVKLKDVLEVRPDDSFYFTENTLERIKTSEKVNRFYNGVEILYNQKGGARMGYSIFGVEGVAPTLTSTTSRHYERYKVGEEFRRLTAIEYARIQGFPDDHCESVRLYDQYPLYGNAVPPALVEWAVKRTLSNNSITFQAASLQMELV